MNRLLNTVSPLMRSSCSFTVLPLDFCVYTWSQVQVEGIPVIAWTRSLVDKRNCGIFVVQKEE